MESNPLASLDFTFLAFAIAQLSLNAGEMYVRVRIHAYLILSMCERICVVFSPNQMVCANSKKKNYTDRKRVAVPIFSFRLICDTLLAKCLSVMVQT